MIVGRKFFRNSKALHAVADAVAIGCGFASALWIFSACCKDNVPMATIALVSFTYTAFSLIILSGFDMYSTILLCFKEMAITIFLSSVYSFFPGLAVCLMVDKTGAHIGFLALGSTLGALFLLLWRQVRNHIDFMEKNKLRLLLIEDQGVDSSRVRRLKYTCLDQFHAWYELVDVNNLRALLKLVKEEFPKYDSICLMETIPVAARDMLIREIELKGKGLYLIPASYDLHLSNMQMAHFDDVLAFGIVPCALTAEQMLVKRAMDILISGIGLSLAGIPMLMIALLIKIFSPGPVFFRQVRLTQNAREFKIIKFRTMIPNAEAVAGPVFSCKDDPRITKIGRMLRATRLDELPQLFNVLAGSMSIVGPRPERPYFAKRFEEQYENYGRRYMTKAGITSLSHVYGRYSTDIADRTRYDLLYVRNYSLRLDFKIMLLTTRVIFLKEAAEGIQSPEIQNTAPWQNIQHSQDASA